MAPTDDSEFAPGNRPRNRPRNQPRNQPRNPSGQARDQEADDELKPIELEPARPPEAKRPSTTPAKSDPAPSASETGAGNQGKGEDAGEGEGIYELKEPEPASEDSSAAPEQMPLRPLPEEDEDRYCLACGYSLRGLDSRECPECGYPFDPTDPNTYRKRPLPSAAVTATRSVQTRVWLGAVLLFLLVGRLVTFLLVSDQNESLTLMATHPFWIAAVVWLTFGIVRNDRFHGLIFWALVGLATGAGIGAIEGPCALASGAIIGLFAGIFREHLDLAST